ncbi:uncharacterized protein LOC114324797 isoform X1 [Diabrotica virgifera virgifera]|uniref:Serine protease gd N-terminal domain-containing protein n=1 Tax=Diabrotica virgifera virgifera TaxID=50390 RepID=A0ABM5IAA1_DIAVI|nr:uncharacterized protein LOC114324797 isoform X1 [Diabrotica virgifera virgifera]XP_028128447.2 uncharacterized protein LOC114324797 isoform X1 [Diabrotica virgifera virgifera]
MEHKYGLAFLLIWMPVILSIRIPPNPCPDIFQYYKDDEGVIYGEAKLPYDNATLLVFSVNASFLGTHNQTALKLEKVTELNELNDGTSQVIYNIFFPSIDVIPKITGLTYNDRIYCSGPDEPVGEAGITNVWFKQSFKFSRQKYGFYDPETKPDTSEDDIPVKSPNKKPTTLPPVSKETNKPKTKPDTSDEDIPVKSPNEKPTTPPRVSKDGFYKPETNLDTSEDDIPVKSPNEKPTTPPPVSKDGFSKPETNPDTSEDDIPVKSPNEKPTTPPPVSKDGFSKPDSSEDDIPVKSPNEIPRETDSLVIPIDLRFGAK